MFDMTNNDLQNVQVDPRSTWANPGIRSLKELKDWVLIKLGAPLVTVELTDEQLNCCIADAISLYSKYEYHPDDYLIVNMHRYEHGKGICLADFNIMSVKDISFQRDNVMGMANDMFFGSYAFFGQGVGSPMFNLGGSNWVGCWTTYHMIHEFFDLSKRMLGSQPDFAYDVRTKYLKLFPEPRGNAHHHAILLTVNKEQPIEQYYGNEYVRRLVLAEAKILLGTIRKKFSSVQLIGGGQIDTTIGDEGKEEKQAALEELIKSESRGQAWFIS